MVRHYHGNYIMINKNTPPKLIVKSAGVEISNGNIHAYITLNDDIWKFTLDNGYGVYFGYIRSTIGYFYVNGGTTRINVRVSSIKAVLEPPYYTPSIDYVSYNSETKTIHYNLNRVNSPELWKSIDDAYNNLKAGESMYFSPAKYAAYPGMKFAVNPYYYNNKLVAVNWYESVQFGDKDILYTPIIDIGKPTILNYSFSCDGSVIDFIAYSKHLLIKGYRLIVKGKDRGWVYFDSPKYNGQIQALAINPKESKIILELKDIRDNVWSYDLGYHFNKAAALWTLGILNGYSGYF